MGQETATIIKRNNVKVFGKGSQPMLLAHGFGCDQNMWRFITPAFEDNYKIVLFDYVGSGHSDIKAYNPERYSDLNGYAQDILDICDALELSQVIFVGHSVSSMIGLIAGIKQPEFFDRMVFIGPSPCYINNNEYKGGFQKEEIDELITTMEQNYIGWSNFLAPVIMKNLDRPELAAELNESFCSTDPVIARKFAEVTFYSDNRDDLSKFSLPSLIMQCSEDIIAPAEVGEYLHERLNHSTLVLLKATGHCPHLSAPAETIEVMKNYLANG